MTALDRVSPITWAGRTTIRVSGTTAPTITRKRSPLVEIDDGTVSLVLEQWEIWRQWEYAFHRGEVLQVTHPGLPGNHLRYAELQTAIKSRIANTLAKPTRARGIFRVDPDRPETPKGVMRELQVEWQVLT
jgi:hypothetical protein